MIDELLKAEVQLPVRCVLHPSSLICNSDVDFFVYALLILASYNFICMIFITRDACECPTEKWSH